MPKISSVQYNQFTVKLGHIQVGMYTLYWTMKKKRKIVEITNNKQHSRQNKTYEYKVQ